MGNGAKLTTNDKYLENMLNSDSILQPSQYPSSIDRYVLLTELGKGAFGVVHKACVQGFPERLLAIKVVQISAYLTW